jgi:hypothetical protein
VSDLIIIILMLIMCVWGVIRVRVYAYQISYMSGKRFDCIEGSGVEVSKNWWGLREVGID